MKKTLLMAALAAAVVGGEQAVSTFTDKRDGKVYRIVQIGRQVWMAENLNFKAKGSKCYENKNANCDKYGRLYDWDTAIKACPAGYHLPFDKEWSRLENAVGGRSTAGKKLKSARGWDNNGNGTDDYGFSALPGGEGSQEGYFYYAGDYGYWWSATENNADYTWGRFMVYDHEFVGGSTGRTNRSKTRLYSVRCVKD